MRQYPSNFDIQELSSVRIEFVFSLGKKVCILFLNLVFFWFLAVNELQDEPLSTVQHQTLLQTSSHTNKETRQHTVVWDCPQ